MVNTKKKQLSTMIDIAYERKGDAFYDDAITYVAGVICGAVNATEVTSVVSIGETDKTSKKLKKELTEIKEEVEAANAEITKLEKEVKDLKSSNKKLVDKNEELAARVAELESLLNNKTVNNSAFKTNTVETTNTVVESNEETKTHGAIISVVNNKKSGKSENYFNYGKIQIGEKEFLYKINAEPKYMLAEVLGATFSETVEATNLLRKYYGFAEAEFNENLLYDCFSSVEIDGVKYNCLIKKMVNSEIFTGYIGNCMFSYTPGFNTLTNEPNKAWIDKCNNPEQHAKLVAKVIMLDADAQRFRNVIPELIDLWRAKQPGVKNNISATAVAEANGGLPKGVSIELADVSSEMTEEKQQARTAINNIIGNSSNNLAALISKAGINTGSSPFGHNFSYPVEDDSMGAE